MQGRETFGLKKRLLPDDPNFPIILRSILERCGRYLKYLDVSNFLNKESAGIIIKECPRLQSVRVNGLDITEEMVEAIKPISDKFKICLNFKTNRNTNNQCMKSLFLGNEKLEKLSVEGDENCDIDGSFLEILPCQRIRALGLRNVRSIPVDTICRVSSIF